MNVITWIKRLFGGAPIDWTSSDFHWHHFNIIGYTNRPFKSVEHMNAELIKRFNKKVKSQDRVYMLGDIGFKSPKLTVEVLNKLNGIKYLVAGNHDGQLIRYMEKKNIKIFEWIKKDYVLEVNYKNKIVKIYLNHYPVRDYPGKKDGLLHFFGHVHNKNPEYIAEEPKMTNVCVENWDYSPINIQEIIKRTENQ